MDRTRPGWNENLHTNYLTGMKIDGIYDLEEGKLFGGMDIVEEKIDSSSFNNHQRMRSTLYSEYRLRKGNWHFALGAMLDLYEDFKNYFLPDISFGYWIDEQLKARAAFNCSLRPPSFTELYYQSAANMGNTNLLPEESKNYELGLDYNNLSFSSAITVFKREGKNLIDWVRAPLGTVYQAKNVAKVSTQGAEFNFKIYPEKTAAAWKSWSELSFGYTYLDRDQKEDINFISKYVFDYLEHKFVLTTKNTWSLDIISELQLNYQQRVNKKGDFIFNAKFSKKIKNCDVFCKIDNLFDRNYTEKGNIPMPGRSIFAGVEAEW